MSAHMIGGKKVDYGYFWWPIPEGDPIHRGAFQAIGIFGQHMYINPMSGEELQQIVRKVAGLSPKVIAMVKEAIKTKDPQELPADQNPKRDSSGGKE